MPPAKLDCDAYDGIYVPLQAEQILKYAALPEVNFTYGVMETCHGIHLIPCFHCITGKLQIKEHKVKKLTGHTRSVTLKQ